MRTSGALTRWCRPPLYSLACSSDRGKYRDDLWGPLVRATPATAPAVVRGLFGDRRILLVSVHDPGHAGLPGSLYANTAMLVTAYAAAFPGRHPHEVLSTSAYDITYFGPGPFRAGHGTC